MSDKEKQSKNREVMHEKLIEYIDLISMQFREPATNIFASLPMLANDINSQNTEKAIDGMQGLYKNSYRILKGINNITIAAKFMEKYQFSKEIIDFSCLVKNVFDKSKQVLPGNVEVKLDIEDNCYVAGNNMLLSVGLLNILHNSLDYPQEDGVKISVSLKRENQSSVLVYRDNSIGVKPHIAPEIFNPFFTVNPYDDGEESTRMGIGLYITQQAILHAGGTIFLQTEFSEGVSYVISLPEKIADGKNMLKSAESEFLLNRYSDIFIQLCEHCNLPDLT